MKFEGPGHYYAKVWIAVLGKAAEEIPEGTHPLIAAAIMRAKHSDQTYSCYEKYVAHFVNETLVDDVAVFEENALSNLRPSHPETEFSDYYTDAAIHLPSPT